MTGRKMMLKVIIKDSVECITLGVKIFLNLSREDMTKHDFVSQDVRMG